MDNILSDQHEVNEKKVINGEKNNNESIDGKSQKTAEYGGRRLSDAGENTGLSTEADNLLAQFRREAEMNQKNADIERDEQQRTVTAFIKEAAATSCARELLEKYTELESRESRLPSKYTKCGNSSASNDYNTKSFVRTSLISDGPSKIAMEQKVINALASGDMMKTNGSCTSEDISRATQTAHKPSGIAISFNESNSISSIENGSMETNKIAYIDEDEYAADSCRINKEGNEDEIESQIRALNDSDDDEVMVKIMSKVSKERENVSTTEANIPANDWIQKNAETIAAVGTQGKHDDNPFTYSAGQLRLHGNRVGTYDMQKCRTLGAKRDVFTTADVSVVPANTSNSLLARDLIPAHFDGRETYARGLLDPTEDARLSPQQQEQHINLDNEVMANLKNQPDKCAIAKRRKENKKAKEAKNSYVVESKDGYMGNLSPEEILKRIEGESKGKSKGNQKNGTGGSKDHSSFIANGTKISGNRKKGDKKDRQTDKAAKRSVIIDREVIELSTNMETSNVEKAKAVIVEKEATVVPKHASLMAARTSKTEAVTSSPQSDKVEEVGSVVTTTAKVTVDEGVDDEEQYLSADEGANSIFSDDIKTELQYHTDEQSGASGSRDFISDGANYRADNEEVNLLPMASEESEFIQVTARSKRRGAAPLIQHQQQTISSGMDRKNVYFNSIIDRSARTNVRRDADRPRRSSVQAPPDSSRNQPFSRGNTPPSPVNSESFQKYSAPPPRLRMLISEIIDNTLMKAQENKGSGRKGQAVSTSSQSQQQRQQEHSKFATSTSMNRKGKYGLPSSLQTSRRASPDRRDSQSLTLKYSVAAGSLQCGSSPAVVSLSEGLSDVKSKIPEQHLDAVAIANTKAPAQRSWADIAKQRLSDNAETRPNEATLASSDLRLSIKEEHPVSGASISGYVESEKKREHNEQKRTVNEETVSSDSTVKDYSFFFDPNEPTGTASRESESKISITAPKETDRDAKSSKPRAIGMVLNLDGGRQVVIPESDVVASSPPAIVSLRQRREVETAITMWRYFANDPAVIVTYREYRRQRDRSQVEHWTPKEEEKKDT